MMRRLVKSERGLLIHIGYMKTASTYLQKAIFCNPDLGFAKIEDPQFFLNEVRNAPEHHFLPENIRAAPAPRWCVRFDPQVQMA